jgi:hypothetical protein
MGKLDDARKAAEAAMQQAMQQGQAAGGGYAAQNIAQAQAESLNVKNEAAALDTAIDPAFAPIEGVSYDDYVKLCVKMQPAGADTAKQYEIAAANGYDEATFKKVSDGYTKRCMENQQFARRLGMDVMAGDAQA